MCGGLNGVGGIIGDDRLEVGSLATFLSPVAIGSICSDVGHLLPFIEDSFCDINAVHCVVSQVGLGGVREGLQVEVWWEWRERSHGNKRPERRSKGANRKWRRGGGLSRSRKRRRKKKKYRRERERERREDSDAEAGLEVPAWRAKSPDVGGEANRAVGRENQRSREPESQRAREEEKRLGIKKETESK